MPDSSNVSPEAEALARVLWPHGCYGRATVICCQRAIDAGWTPPPDPHEDIAQELWCAMYAAGWRDEDCPADAEAQDDLLAAVRRMDLRRGAQP